MKRDEQEFVMEFDPVDNIDTFVMDFIQDEYGIMVYEEDPWSIAERYKLKKVYSGRSKKTKSKTTTIYVRSVAGRVITGPQSDWEAVLFDMEFADVVTAYTRYSFCGVPIVAEIVLLFDSTEVRYSIIVAPTKRGGRGKKKGTK